VQLNPTLAILSDELSPEVFFTLIKHSGKKKLFLVNTFNFRNSRPNSYKRRKKFFKFFISLLEIVELPQLKIKISDQDIYRKTNQLLLDYLDSSEFNQYIKKIISTQILGNHNEGVEIAFKKLYLEELFSITLFNEILFSSEKELGIDRIFIRNLKLLSFKGLTDSINRSNHKIISNICSKSYDYVLFLFFIFTSPRFFREIIFRGIRFKSIILKKYKTSSQIVWGLQTFGQDAMKKGANDFELFDESELEIKKNLFLRGNKFGKSNKQQEAMLISEFDKLDLDSLDESKLAIPVRYFLKNFVSFGFFKRIFNLSKLIFNNIKISLFEVSIIDRINLSILNEKILSCYADVEISISKDDYSFHHIIKTVHQNSHGKMNVGIQHSALSKPSHHPNQAHTFFDIYFTMGPCFKDLWSPHWNKNKKNISVGPHRGHLIEKAKADENLQIKFKEHYPNLNVVMLISPIDENTSPEWLLKESYNNLWKICELSPKLNIILKPRRLEAVSDFRRMFPSISEYEKRGKIFFEVKNFSTQELIAFTDFLVVEEGSGSLSESAFQDHINLSTIVIRTPILDDLSLFSFKDMNELKDHIKIVLEGKSSNSVYLNLKNKYSVDTSVSSWSRIGTILSKQLSIKDQL
tara:strand:- start:4545 stop:6449 length:1905 start_codon:yes stop_codon:yes gene_type:complete